MFLLCTVEHWALTGLLWFLYITKWYDTAIYESFIHGVYVDWLKKHTFIHFTFKCHYIFSTKGHPKSLYSIFTFIYSLLLLFIYLFIFYFFYLFIFFVLIWQQSRFKNIRNPEAEICWNLLVLAEIPRAYAMINNRIR